MIRVAVVDDQELVRSGIAVLLTSDPDIEVVGQAGDGAAAVELVRRTAPDVVLMDVRMPGVDGIEATRRIGADGHPGVRVLMLTTFDEDELVHAALRAGASGFLLKDTRPVELLQAVRVVAAGEALLAPTVTRRLIERFVASTPVAAAAAEQLTEREAEVLLAVARGLSNREIGEALHMGYGTVKTHVSHLLTKVGARDRAQLVMYAYESGRAAPRRPG